MRFVVFILMLVILANIFLGDGRLLTSFEQIGRETSVVKWILIILGSVALTMLIMRIMFMDFSESVTIEEEEPEDQEEDETSGEEPTEENEPNQF